jgi:hypothetical protein
MTTALKPLAERRANAYERFKKGEKPTYSYGICENITAGYGELDYNGYWAYPLDVDQDTMDILPLEEKESV